MTLKPSSDRLFGLLAIVFVATLPSSCGLIAKPLYRHLEAASVVAVDGADVPYPFPVLILIQGEGGELFAHVAPYGDLSKLLRGRPRHTHVIPEGREQEINDQLIRQTRRPPYNDPHHPLPFTMSVHIERDGGEGQLLRTERSWDPDQRTVGWYRAMEDGIVPIRYQDFSASDAILRANAIALAIVTSVWLVLVVAYRRGNHH